MQPVKLIVPPVAQIAPPEAVASQSFIVELFRVSVPPSSAYMPPPCPVQPPVVIALQPEMVTLLSDAEPPFSRIAPPDDASGSDGALIPASPPLSVRSWSVSVLPLVTLKMRCFVDG